MHASKAGDDDGDEVDGAFGFVNRAPHFWENEFCAVGENDASGYFAEDGAETGDGKGELGGLAGENGFFGIRGPGFESPRVGVHLPALRDGVVVGVIDGNLETRDGRIAEVFDGPDVVAGKGFDFDMDALAFKVGGGGQGGDQGKDWPVGHVVILSGRFRESFPSRVQLFSAF